LARPSPLLPHAAETTLIHRSAWKVNSPKFAYRKGCRPLLRVRGPAAIRLRLLPEITPLRLWSGQLLAGLLLSLLLIMRLVVRLFLLGCLIGPKLGVEHGEDDPHETHQPHPARQADP
jgi:hypothetical protein